MKVLILGSGGREHALAWKIAQSPLLSKLYVAPGNPGTAEVAENIPCPDISPATVLSLVQKLGVDLLVVGPEVPLAEGVTDLIQQEAPGCSVFGPTRAASQLEWSKAYAKDFMGRHEIPTATWKQFSSLLEAQDYLEAYKPPLVVKTDGLAAGKGVVVCLSDEDIATALRSLPLDQPVVMEEYLVGRELSLHFVTDGNSYHIMELAEDHKQLMDGDRGPNTGGMGTYSCPDQIPAHLYHQLKLIVEKTLKGLKDDGVVYRGVIFVGLMLTDSGLKVLEYNCRFGDPETQVLLPRVEGDILPYLKGAAEGALPTESMNWSKQSAVCVVACGEEYPLGSSRGELISGVADAKAMGCQVFHAGTALSREGLVTSGGRILGVVGTGVSLDRAIATAYKGISEIDFSGIHYRLDIGKREALDIRR